MSYDNGIRVHGKGVYMLLRKTTPSPGDSPYHWEILIATSDKTGTVFHQIYNRDADAWALSVESSKNITTAPDLLCALKLGVVEDCSGTWMSAIEACVRQTEVKGEFTCRTWALAAAFELADGGFIGMEPSWEQIAKIETEAKVLAGDACFGGTARVDTSLASRP